MTELYRLLAKGARFRATDGEKVRTYTVTAFDYDHTHREWWIETSTVTEEPGKPLFRGGNRLPLISVLARILSGDVRPLKDDEA